MVVLLPRSLGPDTAISSPRMHMAFVKGGRLKLLGYRPLDGVSMLSGASRVSAMGRDGGRR